MANSRGAHNAPGGKARPEPWPDRTIWPVTNAQCARWRRRLSPRTRLLLNELGVAIVLATFVVTAIGLLVHAITRGGIH